MKTKQTIILSIIAILLIVGALFYALQSTIQETDYIIFDDFIVKENFGSCLQEGFMTSSSEKKCDGEKWDLSTTATQSRGKSGYSYNNGISLITLGEASSNLETLFDFSKKDIIIKGTAFGSGDSEKHAEITIGGLRIYNYDGVGQQNFIIKITPSIANENEAILSVNGQESIIGVSTTRLSFRASGTRNSGATLKVSFVGFKYFYNCNIEADDQPIRDDFTEGSIINISTLTYPPTTFCKDNYPAVLRSLTDGGSRADVRGEITDLIAKGKSFTVPKDTILSIQYVADYKQDMGERCTLGSAYNTKTKKCVQVVEEQKDVIKVIRDVVYIQNITVIQNTTIVKEKQNIKEVYALTIGANQIVLKDSADIGDKSISLSKQEFSCQAEGEVFSAPNPRETCWKGTIINLFGINKVLSWGDTTDLNEYLSVRYIGDARYDKDVGIVDENKRFLITLKDKSFITTKALKGSDLEKDYYTEINTPKAMKFEITNKLSNFNEDQSGFKIIKTKGLIFIQTSELKAESIKKGTVQYELDVDTSQLGEITYVIQPYVSIGGNKIFDDEVLVFNFYIKDKEAQPPSMTLEEGKASEIVSQNTQTPEQVIEQVTKTENKTPNLLIWGAFGVLVLLFLVGVIMFLAWRKK